MFWLGGFPTLEVTTSTPDALCPPIEEARAAIEARVGEVRGDYRVEFALIRAIDGGQVLELTMREVGQQVLQRELRLDGDGCRDAAQAIALVLERYFDAVQKPHTIEPNREPIPVRLDDKPMSYSSPTPASDTGIAPSLEPSARNWRVRAGFVYDLDLGIAPTLGVALFPSAFRLKRWLELGVMLDLAPFLTAQSQTVREQEIRVFTLQTALSVPVVWRREPWSAALGLWTQLRFQRAEGTSLAHEQPAYRAVAGAGGLLQLAWSPGPRWTIGLGAAAGAQAVDRTARFVLRSVDSGPKPVLVPETWFGQGQLTLSHEL